MNWAILMLFLLLACAKDKTPIDPDPVKLGKCRVLKFEGGARVQQECEWEGAQWDCSRTPDDAMIPHTECTRKASLPPEVPPRG